MVQKLIESQEIQSPSLVIMVDIGGNRELESLGALLPWLQKSGILCIQPRLFIVKSQTLYNEMKSINLDSNGWPQLQTKCANIVIKRGSENSKHMVEVKCDSGNTLLIKRKM